MTNATQTSPMTISYPILVQRPPLVSSPSPSPRPRFARLSTRERARLVRSSRKVQAVLGETPQLQLNPSTSRRYSYPSPASRARSASVAQRVNRRPILLARIPDSSQTRPSPALDTISCSPVSPASGADSDPSTPVLSPQPLDTHLSHTRTLAKLTRTLGERVPADLVLPRTPTGTSGPGPARRARASRRTSSISVYDIAQRPASTRRPSNLHAASEHRADASFLLLRTSADERRASESPVPRVLPVAPRAVGSAAQRTRRVQMQRVIRRLRGLGF
ncbi:hypothetical protein MIND_00407100 [Mycena indigotica]|uniref:Uncharacterized protein n=1 Tax=Mycena indigotica TaxID=2126181 RepID=A0A8H6T6I4_9AGAR|nr:uncharacterized protein MIND_00407100 [Mycena indigotica]KAF7310330.1 hypothetical protein MIND_00407100 [Mycena indigotica]